MALRPGHEVSENIHRESGSGDPTRGYRWPNRGWRIFETTALTQLNNWQRTGRIEHDLTVAQMMERVYLPEDFGSERYERFRSEIAASSATPPGSDGQRER